MGGSHLTLQLLIFQSCSLGELLDLQFLCCCLGLQLLLALGKLLERAALQFLCCCLGLQLLFFLGKLLDLKFLCLHHLGSPIAEEAAKSNFSSFFNENAVAVWFELLAKQTLRPTTVDWITKCQLAEENPFGSGH
jgi:hypothetical protein